MQRPLAALASSTYRPVARSLATLADGTTWRPDGPLEEYDRRVEAGMLRNDEHQRGEATSLEVSSAGR